MSVQSFKQQECSCVIVLGSIYSLDPSLANANTNPCILIYWFGAILPTPILPTPTKARQSGFTVYRPRLHATPRNSPKFHISRGLPRGANYTASFASVHVSAANKTIVPWSVISLDPSQNFGELFWSVQAGKYAIVKTSTDLTAAVLESSGVSVGKDKSSLSLIDKHLNTVDVCTAFGHFVKFTVILNKPGISSSLDVSKNAFEIMKPKLQAFFDHCCQVRHYSFCIKKCGSSECEICKPV